METRAAVFEDCPGLKSPLEVPLMAIGRKLQLLLQWPLHKASYNSTFPRAMDPRDRGHKQVRDQVSQKPVLLIHNITPPEAIQNDPVAMWVEPHKDTRSL